MEKLKSINQQVVVICGASSGIGRLAALRFAQNGAKVVVVARSEKSILQLAQEIRNQGGEATAISGDVIKYEDMERAAAKAIEVYGRLDTWVHAAAISLYATFEETSPEEYGWVLEVNLKGQFHGAKAALPWLKKEGRGALIHISSIEGRRAFPYQTAYASSKHGLNGMLDVLRVELKKEGWPISVTTLMPGSTNTPFFEHARTKIGVKPAPAPPIYQPDTVVDLILYAAEHRIRHSYSGGAAKLISVLQTLSPHLADFFMQEFGFKLQRTKVPKSESAPNNFYEPVEDPRIEGEFSHHSKKKSLYNWMMMNPMVRWAAYAVVFILVLAWIS